jgi:glutamine transport system substrate-binding protein
MKRWSLFTIAAVLLVSLAACGTKDNSSGSGNSDGSGKTYKFATDASYAPMESMDKDKIVGFDVDFLDAVMKEAGLKYELNNVGWDAMLESVKQGKEYDGSISAVSITDDRKKTYDFSVPYFESTNMIMVKEGSDIKTALDLKGKKVAVQGSTTANTLMEGILGKGSSDLRKFDSNALAFLEMDNGGVDAVVADSAVVHDYIKKNPDKKYVGLLDPTNFAAEYYGILLPKGSDLKAKLDPAITKVLNSDKYAEIYKKWKGDEPNVQNVLNAAK